MNKRILFVVKKLSDGGAERVVSVLASKLAEDGNDVYILVYFPTTNEYLTNNLVKKVYMTKDENEYQMLGFGSKIALIRRKLKGIQPDFVIPFLYFVGVHVQLAHYGLKGKVVQTVRNDPRSVPEDRVERLIRDITYSFMWRGFVQNRRQLEYFPRFIQKKLVVLPNPVSEQFLNIVRPERKLFTILAAGRLQRQKNFPMLIRAAKLLKEKGYNFRICIYGEGELAEELNSFIAEYDVAGYCMLCGRSNNMSATYQEADVFVMTSNFEGMPNALMEAMASGLPCISTDCPTGPSELIENGVNGFLIEMDNHEQLANKIEDYFNNEEIARMFGKRAKNQIMLKYSPAIIARRFTNEVLRLE